MTKPTQISRRQMLKGSAVAVASIPLASIATRVAHAETVELPKLSADDAFAAAIGYTPDAATADGAEATFKAGSNCANCQLYTGGDAEYGPCSIVPGKLVSAEGWCRTWAPKAG